MRIRSLIWKLESLVHYWFDSDTRGRSRLERSALAFFTSATYQIVHSTIVFRLFV